MALVMVSASCGNTRIENPCCHSSIEGNVGIEKMAGSAGNGSPGEPSSAPRTMASARPISAAGQLGKSFSVTASNPRTTRPSGREVAINSRLMLASNNPSPSCRPLSTDPGTRRAARLINPVDPRSNRMAPIRTPLAIRLWALTWVVNSNAATAFMGCTGTGRR